MKSSENNGNQGYRLPRSLILRGKRNFDRIFQQGTRLSGNNIDLRYYLDTQRGGNCLAGFVTARILGSAVKRNKIKRVLREAYRLNRYLLGDVCNQPNYQLHLVLIAKTVRTDFNSVNDDTIMLLSSLQQRLDKLMQP